MKNPRGKIQGSKSQLSLNLKKHTPSWGGVYNGRGLMSQMTHSLGMWRLIQRYVQYTLLLDALRKTEHTAGHIHSPF